MEYVIKNTNAPTGVRSFESTILLRLENAVFSRIKMFQEVDNNLPLATSILALTAILGYRVVDYIIAHVTAGNRQIMGVIFMVAVYAWIVMFGMAVIYTYRSYRSVRALQKSRKQP